LRTADFDYTLPPELIAQAPAPERGASRLLHVDGAALADLRFAQLPQLVRAGDVLVLNDTRVIHARLRGRKPTGGAVEIMIERVIGERRALTQVRAGKGLRAGGEILLEQGSSAHSMKRESSKARLIERDGEFFVLEFDEPVEALLERIGEVPLPPYIAHAPDAQDRERYQTVFARAPGAVAAPTAGLHFDAAMLARLEALGVVICYVTLHVGAGTFQPVRAEDVGEHRMHSERYWMPGATARAIERARADGGRVFAVGTTSLRALESAAAAAGESGALREMSGETSLFITPGFRFRVVDRLLTNFHLPRSTLMMLVCAFGGHANLVRAYAHAVAERYRFFSYGDAMLIERKPNND
jgi:S-adenosylmethionine:tRNA ribosyltransferase-isomerase